MSNTSIYTLRRTAFGRASINRSTVAPDTGRSLILRGGATFDCVTIASIATALPFSLGIWFNLSQTGSNFLRLLSFRSITSGQYGGFELEENANVNKLTLGGYDSAGTAVFTLAPATTFSFNAWHHVALVFAPNNNVFYIDGAQVASDTSHTIAIPGGQALTIGKPSFTSGSPWAGQVDQFVFAPTAWSGTTISSLYSTGIVPSDATCVLNFDERNGSACTDASGDGNNGTFTGDSSANGRSSNVPPHQPTYPRAAVI